MKSYHNGTIPLEAQYLFRRGLEMIDQQKADIALVYLRQAVFIAPGFSKAYRELGNCLARLGRSEEASIYRMKASRIDPVHRGAVVDHVTLKRQDEEQAVPGHFLTCLIWKSFYYPSQQMDRNTEEANPAVLQLSCCWYFRTTGDCITKNRYGQISGTGL